MNIYSKIHIRGNFRKRWYLQPVCWLLKHKKRIRSTYGLRHKQCERCGMYFFNKTRNGRTYSWKRYEGKEVYAGEVGELYGVKFIQKKEQ